MKPSNAGGTLSEEEYRELLIGCGSRRDKIIFYEGKKAWVNLTTLDINIDHLPDVVWDLNNTPLPFDDDSFDEIHAYEVLEHIGIQGDYKFFFDQFSDFWRILKPNGAIIGICPMFNSPWAYGDPSHTRVIQKENFVFLDQAQYTIQVGKTPMSDFRYIYKADFNTTYIEEKDGSLLFALTAVKPSRIK